MEKTKHVTDNQFRMTVFYLLFMAKQICEQILSNCSDFFSNYILDVYFEHRCTSRSQQIPFWILRGMAHNPNIELATWTRVLEKREISHPNDFFATVIDNFVESIFSKNVLIYILSQAPDHQELLNTICSRERGIVLMEQHRPFFGNLFCEFAKEGVCFGGNKENAIYQAIGSPMHVICKIFEPAMIDRILYNIPNERHGPNANANTHAILSFADLYNGDTPIHIMCRAKGNIQYNVQKIHNLCIKYSFYQIGWYFIRNAKGETPCSILVARNSSNRIQIQLLIMHYKV